MAMTAAASAQQPTQAQASAIRSACRSDYQSYCSGVPTGGQASLQCLQQNAQALSSGCQQALAAISGGGGGGGGAGAGQAAPPMGQPAAPHPALAMSPRQKMAILRADCGYDYRRFCRGVQPGGGRGISCLEANGPSLTPQCQSALLSMRRP
jgi:hypothetical protein